MIPRSQREITHIVDVNIFDDGCPDDCAYRPEFITSDRKQIPIDEVYTNYYTVLERVTNLRRQMNSRESNFEYKIEPQWWILFFLVGFLLVEALLLTRALLLDLARERFANRESLKSEFHK